MALWAAVTYETTVDTPSSRRAVSDMSSDRRANAKVSAFRRLPSIIVSPALRRPFTSRRVTGTRSTSSFVKRYVVWQPWVLDVSAVGSVDPHVSDDGSAQRWSVKSLRDGAHDPVGEFAEVSGQLGRSAHFELAAQVQDL